MSKGTILYLGGFELPDKNAAAHRVLSNGKILKELGYQVVFIDVDKSLDFNSNVLKTNKQVQGFECWSIPYPKTNKEWFLYLVSIESIKKIINQYKDVKAIIAYNYQAIALNRLNKFCNNQGIKTIADCTEWYTTKGANIIFKVIKGLDSFLRMRIIQKKLDGIIVISKYLESYYNSCRNVVRIPPLVDLKEDKWNIPYEESRDNKVRFVYSGSPGKNKDKINLLIEALYDLEQHDNYLFNIVGITKEQYINDYPEHLEMLNSLGKRIIFLGRVRHIESLKYLKKSDFSVFVRENTRVTMAGFPTKFVESISSGIPVITNKNSDLEDYIKNGENGFFVNENILEGFKRVISMDPEKIKFMKIKINSDTFSIEGFKSEFKRLFEKL